MIAFITRVKLWQVCRLLDTSLAARLLASAAIRSAEFNELRIANLRTWANQAFNQSRERSVPRGSSRLLYSAAFEYAVALRDTGNLADLKRVLNSAQLNKSEYLTANDINALHAGLIDGSLIRLGEALAELILRSVRENPISNSGSSDELILPSFWTQSISLDEIAAVFYLDELKLREAAVFHKSDSLTRQYYRQQNDLASGFVVSKSIRLIPAARVRATARTTWALPMLAMVLAFVAWMLGAPLILSLAALPILLDSIDRIDSALLIRRRQTVFLPAYDISCGSSGKAPIVVPLLLHDALDISQLAKRLRQNALSTQASSHVVVLTDFSDTKFRGESLQETKILEALVNELEAEFMNVPCHWCVLHRDRTYSSIDEVYQGWERKRGKLLQFSAYVRGENTVFTRQFGVAEGLNGAEWMCVLDEDCELDWLAVDVLLASASHPLNLGDGDEPKSSHRTFGIYAPLRCTRHGNWNLSSLFSLKTYRDKWFERFGESGYFGKALVHIDGIRGTVKRIPSGRVLSHDLAEGFLLRTGYCQGASLSEQLPDSYHALCDRLHRWVRGDIQNITFGRAFLGGAFAQCYMTVLMGRRISQVLYPIFVIACIEAADTKGVITIALLLTSLLLAPTIRFLSDQLIGFVPSISWMVMGLKRLIVDVLVSMFRIILMAHHATLVLHAAGVSLYRAFSKRNLLEWRTMSAGSILNAPSDVALMSSSLFALGMQILAIIIGASPFSIVVLAVWASFPWGCRKLFASSSTKYRKKTPSVSA